MHDYALADNSSSIGGCLSLDSTGISKRYFVLISHSGESVALKFTVVQISRDLGLRRTLDATTMVGDADDGLPTDY